MDSCSSLLHRIIQKNRDAICGPDSYRNSWKISHNRIATVQLILRDVYPVDYSHLHIMNLVHLHYRTRQSLIPSDCPCTDIRMNLVSHMIIRYFHYCSSTPNISLSEVGSFFVTVDFFAIFLSWSIMPPSMRMP